ncbi:hypothetical protein CQW23_08913 [Capsicum baccatum]|uniref:Uncharacterized protein n=1 Tax=Capsicum baccatum TaxID=33114 RepID=A0A2G2XAR9_CAPBA|nr:hypothetical protein CQW23_08913 [Capsicum baccatum]
MITKNGPIGALDFVAWLDKASAGPIPKSAIRFAHQYRCRPPLEFSLASPRSGIVYHLSGPNRFTRPLTHTQVKLLGPFIKMGQMGSPQASVHSVKMPKHAGGSGHNGALTLSSASSRGLGLGAPLRTLHQTTIRTMEPPDSKAGRFSVRSSLLRESFLGQRTAHVAAIRSFHRIIQSLGATSGVYKRQGRSQRKLMTRAYQEFLVEDQQLQ